jgi:hypothetical protein
MKSNRFGITIETGYSKETQSNNNGTHMLERWDIVRKILYY